MEYHKSRLEKLAPKKFCCRFELKQGCKIIGIILVLVMAGCTISTVIQTLGLQECSGCGFNSWKHAYGYSISACIYCGLMFLVNLWFLWGVDKEKKSVVIAWVVISAVWLAQTSCLLVVLIVEYYGDVGLIVWCISLALMIIAILVLVYFVLAGYGYWLQLRNKKAIPEGLNLPKIFKT